MANISVIWTELRKGLWLRDTILLLTMSHKTYKCLSFVLPKYKLVHTLEKIILLYEQEGSAPSMHKSCFSWLQRFCTCASLKHIGKIKTLWRIILSFAILVNHTLTTRETTNDHRSETGRLMWLVPLSAWHSMSVSRKKERKKSFLLGIW